jgi:hypothetical protein
MTEIKRFAPAPPHVSEEVNATLEVIAYPLQSLEYRTEQRFWVINTEKTPPLPCPPVDMVPCLSYREERALVHWCATQSIPTLQAIRACVYRLRELDRSPAPERSLNERMLGSALPGAAEREMLLQTPFLNSLDEPVNTQTIINTINVAIQELCWPYLYPPYHAEPRNR